MGKKKKDHLATPTARRDNPYCPICGRRMIRRTSKPGSAPETVIAYFQCDRKSPFPPHLPFDREKRRCPGEKKVVITTDPVAVDD